MLSTTPLLGAQALSVSTDIDFDIEHGGYSIPVSVEGHTSPIQLLIDTGSSNLNLIGAPKICPSCEPITGGKQRYQAKAPVKKIDKKFEMHYGAGSGKLQQYQGNVNLFDKKLRLDNYTFGVYQSGKYISNIVGFAFEAAAAPRKAPLPTLFSLLNKKYDFNNQFTLQYCDTQGTSKLYLGPTPKIFTYLPQYSTPVMHKSLYFIQHFGVSTPDGDKLIDVPKGDYTIVDSGTTAKIIYPAVQIKSLIEYLKKHTDAKNQKLPEVFWKGKTCIEAVAIDIKAFPTLYFHFKDIHGKPFKLPLPPERYVTQSACGKGYYKLAFIGMDEHRKDKKNLHHKKNQPGFAILGTPFIEQYATSFKQAYPAILTFYDGRDILCGKNK